MPFRMRNLGFSALGVEGFVGFGVEGFGVDGVRVWRLGLRARDWRDC